MNKKTVLSVLLCCAVLSTATSCNHKDSIHSENSTDSQLSTETNFEIDAIQMVKNDYSLLLEDNISKKVKFHSYDDILKRYRILLSNEHNEEATHTIGEYFDTNDYTIETALQSLVINSHRNQTQMGYAIYDINGDTQTELILMDDQYHIYAVFTQMNEIPVLLDQFSFNNHYVSLDQNGIFYKTGYGKGENSYTKIMQITNRGELETLLEYGYDDVNCEYYIIENEVKRVATVHEITHLKDRYDIFLQYPTATTKKSGIPFVPAIPQQMQTNEMSKYLGNYVEYGTLVDVDTLNVRSEAGTSFKSLGKLHKGDTVEILEKNCATATGYTWHKILYNGSVGYVVAGNNTDNFKFEIKKLSSSSDGAIKSEAFSFEKYIGTWYDDFNPPHDFTVIPQDNGEIKCQLGIYRLTTFYLNLTVKDGEISFKDDWNRISGKIDFRDNSIYVTVEKSNAKYIQSGANWLFTMKSENTNITTTAKTNPYDSIIEMYKEIVHNHQNPTESGNADFSQKWYTELYGATLIGNVSENTYGYAFCDLNGDGESELVLLLDDGTILSVFSMVYGNPFMLDDFHSRKSCWIDNDKILHVCGSNGADHWSYSEYTLSADGTKLNLIFEYGSEGYDSINQQNMYYMISDSDKISIGKEKFDELSSSKPYISIKEAAEKTKGNKFLEFISLQNNTSSSQNSSLSVILNDILQQQYTWSEFNAIYPQYKITAQSPIAMNVVVPEFENVIFVFAGDLDDNISEYKMASANAGGDVLLPEHFGKTFDQILSEEAVSASAEPSSEFMQHLYKYETIYIYREDFYYYIRGYRHTNELTSEHIAMFRYDESHNRPW